MMTHNKTKTHNNTRSKTKTKAQTHNKMKIQTYKNQNTNTPQMKTQTHLLHQYPTVVHDNLAGDTTTSEYVQNSRGGSND